jgi:hypothetical protein
MAALPAVPPCVAARASRGCRRRRCGPQVRPKARPRHSPRGGCWASATRHVVSFVTLGRVLVGADRAWGARIISRRPRLPKGATGGDDQQPAAQGQARRQPGRQAGDDGRRLDLPGQAPPRARWASPAPAARCRRCATTTRSSSTPPTIAAWARVRRSTPSRPTGTATPAATPAGLPVGRTPATRSRAPASARPPLAAGPTGTALVALSWMAVAHTATTAGRALDGTGRDHQRRLHGPSSTTPDS